jgi:septum formation protein
MKIILGSSSKYRRAVLEKNGYTVDTMSPDIDEKAIRTDDYYQLPLLLARAKREALLPRVSEDALVITTDIVVVCNGNLHEKPVNEDEVKLFLGRYSQGYPAELVSAVTVTNTMNGKQADGVEIAKVYYNFIPAAAADEFIKNGDPYTKAGGFAIQSPILQPYMNRIEGAEDCVYGMPLKLLNDLIAKMQS